ncbi:MAG: TIGR01620 family protein [Cyanobacteria bacterium MAG CAR1_bin_15]|nr:TIGR01620 family protein [Cyanobacteria bacterium MAG CAR1_bin_15]
MTIDATQRLSAAEEASGPDQEGTRRPRKALRFPVPDGESPQSALETGLETEARSPAPRPKVSPPLASASEDPHQISERQLSREETSSPVAENVKQEKEDNRGPEGALRVPMPVPGPEEKPQPSGLKQPLSVAMSLPWFTWFLVLLAATILFLCGISLWNTLNELWERSAVVGMAGLVLTGLLVLVTTAVAIQEWQAMQRIHVLEEIRQQAERSLAPANDVGDLALARKVINRLIAVYSSRDDTRKVSQRLAERQGDIFAASGLITLAETEILKTLDDRAEKVIGDAALRIAAETAFMPWPLADVLLVFLSSMQMFRHIAQIYGSRPGVVASWTLSRKVLAQLVVAGALSEVGRWADAAVGQRFLHLARPIGEGITNATLLARSGVTAMELCRPLPFQARQRPSITVFDLIKKGLVTLKRDGRNTETAQQNA